MFRYIKTEVSTAVATGKFSTGDTVTIRVWNKATGVIETLTSNACTEIGTTGYFSWAWSNLITPPAAFTEYLWEMDNGAGAQRAEEAIFGGWPDLLVSTATALTGANPVTINVQEADTTPIANVKLSIYAAADTSFITPLGTGQTDASGKFVFTFDNGSYVVRLAKTQVNFAASEVLTVSGTTTVTYNGEVLTIPVSGLVNVCRVVAYGFNQSGSNPLTSLEGTAQIKNMPFKTGNIFHEGQKINLSFSTQTGLFFWDLPYGAVVYYKVPSLAIAGQATVPNTAQQDLTGLTLT